MRKKIFVVLTILWMTMIFYMSNQPATVSTEQSNSTINMLSTLPIVGNVIDAMIEKGTATVIVRKGAHMFSYAIMSVLCFFSIYNLKINLKNICIKSILVAFIYACTDEFHQLFIPGRSGELRDVLIDTTGAVISMCITYFIIRKINQKRILEDKKY
ncbi:VanZ family protein [Romboutsia sp.]|uniref:VanZ family protein n=1 Tax=Romboutsia sp. TaxID=1965302 RepID=UPI003F2A170B